MVIDMAKRQDKSLDFKRKAVEELSRCQNVAELADQLKVNRTLLYQWKRQLEGRPGRRRADLSQETGGVVEKALRQENQLLKVALAEKELEAGFFAAALRRYEQRRQNNTSSGAKASTSKSESGREQRKAK